MPGTLDAGPASPFLDLLLEPTQVTTATLLSWYRSTENVQMASPLIVTAGGGPIITLSGNLIQSLGIKVQITPDSTHYRYSINNGTTWLEENVPKTSTPHEVDSLGVFLNITAGGYINGTVEEVVQQSWLDKTANGYNFTNATIGQRPRIFTVGGQNNLPFARYNGTTMRLLGPAGLAAHYSGLNTPYYNVMVFYVTTVPTGTNVATVYTIGASAGDDARIELQITATNWRARRQANAGTTVLTNASAALVPQVGICVVEDEFDGVERRISVNSADIIGGTSGTKAIQSLGTPLSMNQVSLMAQVIPSGTANLLAGDMYELACFSGVPTRQQKLGVVNYLMQRYGLKNRSAQNLPMPFVEWDGVHTKNPNPTAWGLKTTLFNPGNLDSDKVRFGYRKPTRSDGTKYWFMQGTGDPVTDELNMTAQQEQLIEMAAFTKRVIRVPDWYPTADLITSGPVNVVETIWQAGYENYEINALRSMTPFCLNLQSFWARYDVNSMGGGSGTWLNYPAFVAYWVSLMQLPNYFRLSGNRPVIYFFNNPAAPWDNAHKTTLVNAIVAAGLGSPVIYESTESTTTVVNLQLDGQTSYGPAGGAPAGATNQHLAYSTQITADRANFVKRAVGVPNAKFCPPLTLGNDARPQRGEPPTSWYVDEPIYGQLEGHARDWAAFIRMNATLCPDMMGLIYAFNENGECGDVLPTSQSRSIGPFGTTLGWKFEILMSIRTENFPDVFQNYYNSYTNNAGITRSAGWTIIQDLWDTAGEGEAWQFAAARSSTAGAVFTCNPPSNAPDATTPAVKQFEWFGTVGPGYGDVEFRVDGVLVATVSCAAVSLLRHQLLFTSAVLVPGAHSSTATVVGTGMVEIDLVRVTVDRS